MKLNLKFRRRQLEEEHFDAEGQKLPGRRERSFFARAKKADFVDDSEEKAGLPMLARPLLKGGLE
jgi:hypothetical protein